MSSVTYISISFAVIAVILAIIFFSMKRGVPLLPVIAHLLAFVLVFSLCGLVALAEADNPKEHYLLLQGTFFILGIVHTWLLYRLHPWSKGASVVSELVFTLLLSLLGGAGFLLVFQMLSQATVSWAVATVLLPFFIPFFFHKTFALWKVIPAKIYYVWQYLEQLEVPEIVQSEAIRVHFRIARDPNSQSLSKFTVKAPMNMKFGDLFHYFLYDYNSEHPTNQILANGHESPFGWYFYIKRSWWKKKEAIDPNISVYRNQLSDNIMINAKRVYLDY